MRINLICLGGSLLGMISIFLPWSIDSLFNLTISTNLIEFYDSADPSFGAAVIIFIFGSILTFFFPLAGAIQFSGLIIFLASYLDRSIPLLDLHSNLGIGFYLGTISSILAILSFGFPFGRDTEWRILSIRKRLTTFPIRWITGEEYISKY